MKRRQFLTSSLAASAFALAGNAAESQVASNGTPREYYELRQYHMQNGPQTKLTDAYVSDALIPALNRLGISPVGAFNLTLGPETPTLYVLLPSIRLETLVTAQLQLAQDATFMQAAAPFWNAPANQPAYVRVESSLMIAFEGRPRLKVPPVTADRMASAFFNCAPTKALAIKRMFAKWRCFTAASLKFSSGQDSGRYFTEMCWSGRGCRS